MEIRVGARKLKWSKKKEADDRIPRHISDLLIELKWNMKISWLGSYSNLVSYDTWSDTSWYPLKLFHCQSEMLPLTYFEQDTIFLIDSPPLIPVRLSEQLTTLIVESWRKKPTNNHGRGSFKKCDTGIIFLKISLCCLVLDEVFSARSERTVFSTDKPDQNNGVRISVYGIWMRIWLLMVDLLSGVWLIRMVYMWIFLVYLCLCVCPSHYIIILVWKYLKHTE